MNRPVSDTTSAQHKIESAIDKDRLAVAEVSKSVGGLAFSDMGQVMEFSKLMAVAGQAIPKHLRGQPGACMAVSMQALNWRMDPFAVANKSYMVNDRIAYEAQLIHAVIEQRAPIVGRLKGEYTGEGGKRKLRIWCKSAEDGDTVEYISPEIGLITTKNSPLWKGDPDQQLWYYSARAMCRRHFPDVLLGVYEREEIQQAEPIRDITPKAGGFAQMAAKAREEAKPEPEQEPAPIDGEVMPDAPEFDEDAVDPMTDAYDEGFKAHQEGSGEDINPHEPGSEEWTNWLGGYRFRAANHSKAEEE